MVVTRQQLDWRRQVMPISRQSGVTLLEMIVFIVVVSIALTTLTAVYNQAVTKTAEPWIS